MEKNKFSDEVEVTEPQVERAEYAPRWDDNEERTLVRTIDFRIFPVVVVLFLLNYLDRVNFATARLKGLEQDLGLSDVEYQTCISILFVGYISMQIPSNMVLNKITRPSWYIGALTFIWGSLTVATGGVKNPAGAITVRFFLGCIEAGFFPGIAFYCTRWYRRDEIALRITIFACGNALANMFGGLIGAGILSGMEGVAGLPAWRWLFYIEGILTVVVAVLIPILLPDYPATTTWLSDKQRYIAQARLALDVGLADDDEKGSALSGLKMALLDPKVWALAICFFTFALGMTFAYFFPTIAQSLGYGPIVTLLLTAPPWAFAAIVALILAWTADRGAVRSYLFMGVVGAAMVGGIIAVTTKAVGSRYFAFFLMCTGFSGTCLISSWVPTTIARPPAKRAAAIAIVNAVGNAGSIPASYLWPAKWGPRYPQSFGATISFLGASTLMALCLRFYLQYLNKKLDREEAVAFQASATAIKHTAELEGTSQEDAANHSKDKFRYIC